MKANVILLQNKIRGLAILLCTILLLGGLYAQNNVGIGTTSPTSPLTVVANGLGKGIIQKTGDTEIGFYTNASGAFIQTWSNNNLNFTTNNSSAQMTLSTSGNLGIGTVLPGAKLDVNGTVRIRGGSPVAGYVLTATDANGNAIWQPSGVGITKILNIHSSAFMPTNSNAGWTGGGASGQRPTSANSGFTFLIAPLLLPAGSVITGIDWLFKDEEESKNFEFKLYADKNYATVEPGPFVLTVASANSSGSNSSARLVKSVVNNHVMDNTPYYLSVAVENWPTIASMGILGARVYYK
jgi:hypothetical protein